MAMKPRIPSLRYQRIFQAVASGATTKLLTSGLTLISLPLAVRYLGAERYGVWVTVATTAVWLNLFDLGIANTLTNHISRAYALNDKAAAARYFTNALVLTGGLAAAVGLLLSPVIQRINWLALFNASSRLSEGEVRHTVGVAVALTLLGLPCNLAGKLLGGYQELHRYNCAACAGAVASVAGLALGVMLGASMPILLLMSVGWLGLANLIMLILTVGWLKPWLLPRPSLVDRSSIRELLNSGSAFFLIQIAAVVVFSTDNLIVSHWLGASEVTAYSVTWRFVGVAAVLQSLIFPALWPAYAEAYCKRDYLWIRRTFACTMKGTLALNISCAVFLAFFGRSIIRLWAGAAAVPTNGLLLAMGLWAVINGFMSVESCLLAAVNRTRQQAVLSVIAAAANVGLSILLVRHVGAIGVIGGTILSYLLVLVIPQSLIVRKLWRRELLDTEASPAIRGPLFASAGVDMSASRS